MSKRAYGTGSITPIASGFMARLPINGKRELIGIFPTEAEAGEALDATRLKASTTSALTFAKFGEKVLDSREDDGVRSVKDERRRFKGHLEECAFANLHIADVTPLHISDLGRTLSKKMANDNRGERKISRGTVNRCRALVRAIFNEAITSGLRPDNPCAGVKLKKKADESSTKEPWTFLTLKEQRAVATCEEIPEWARLMLRIAIGTGLRQGEQWNLELRDFHTKGKEPVIFVRFGSKALPPKNGKLRSVPLFGDALLAAKRWLEVLPTYAPVNPLGLVFPTVTGCRRGIGAPEKSVRVKDENGKSKPSKVELLPIWLGKAGITRDVRWHDLRHTCCSSLVAGWWGREWSLLEVRDMAGHSSILVTEMYAHLGKTGLKTAARETQDAQSRKRKG